MAERLIDVDDLTTLTYLAKMLGIGRSTVAMWDNRRESTGFPQPVIDLGPRARLWSRKEVGAWLEKQ